MKGSLKKFLREHKDELTEGDGKVIANLTGHEMPKDLEAIERYVNGKAYRKAKVKRETGTVDLGEFEPYFQEDKNRPSTHVFCIITKQYLNRNREEILAHVNGRRYKHHLAVYKRKEAKKAKAEDAEGMESDSDDDPEDEMDDDIVLDSDEDEEEGTADDMFEFEDDSRAQPRQKKATAKEDDADAFWIKGKAELRREVSTGEAIGKRKERPENTKRKDKALKQKQKKAR